MGKPARHSMCSVTGYSGYNVTTLRLETVASQHCALIARYSGSRTCHYRALQRTYRCGIESESLRSHFAWLLRDRRSIVLHLGEVAFIDSSGLGTLVRTLTSARQARAVLKLCNVPPPLLKLLDLSHLTSLFESHESEEAAIASF